MAHVLKPRVAETSTTTGTGAFTLTGALTAHQTFASVMSTSDTTEYMIVAVDGSGAPSGAWEEGLGTYSGTNTLTRTTVTNSSNAGSAVSFAAGDKVVLMTPLASRVNGIPRSTAMVKGDGGGALVAATAGTDYVAPGGALGTPSSGTVTNLTGTASININGTVGATTRNTGAFTTVDASGAIKTSGQAAANQTSAGILDFYTTDNATRILSWGSAGVAGKVSFWTGNGGSGTTEKFKVDDSGGTFAGSAAFGTTLSSWNTNLRALQVSTTGSVFAASNVIYLGQNFYSSAGGDLYLATGAASFYSQSAGAHTWSNAASGTAGNAVTFTERMKLDASGNLKIAGLTASKAVFTDASKNLTSTGTLGVDQGGTGATTLTGVLKGNGTSAFTAAVAGTDYASPSQTFYIGTTQVAINRASGALTLDGITLTDPTIVGAIIEDVFPITDGAAFEVNPSNGTIQTITLGANRTPKATSFAAGESVTMMVLDGAAYTLTWTDATWGGSGVVWVGGTAPTLDTTKYTVIELWKVGTQVYGALVGYA